jgi:hypothetical protein
MSLTDFSALAPALTNPLVLIGFVIFLMFGIQRTLIASGIIPPIAKVHAPRIVKLILSYGFWLAALLIVFGFAYAFLKVGLDTWTANVTTLSTQKSQLKLVDTYVDDQKLINIKLKNDGTGDAFIYELRFLLYPGAGLASVCMPAIFTLLEFPFSISTDGASVDTTTGKGAPIPEEFMNLPPSLMRHTTLFGETSELLPKPVRLTDPLKVGERVPGGGVEWLKLKVVRTIPARRDCGWIEAFNAHVVIYYEGGHIVTPVIDLPRL